MTTTDATFTWADAAFLEEATAIAEELRKTVVRQAEGQVADHRQHLSGVVVDGEHRALHERRLVERCLGFLRPASGQREGKEKGG